MMKNLTKIFMAVVAGLFAFSCVQDTTEDLGIKVDGQSGVTELVLSLEASRTHLGEKVEDLYPLYWSEGDAISVNGVVSNPLVGVAEGTTAATFKFNEEVARPLCIVYPAAAVATVEDEVVEEPAPVTAYPVTFLAEQPYTVGTFAPQAAPMYGYGAELGEGEAETPVQLNHLTGVLRLAVKGNGEKVTSIVVKAEKGKIAGPFTVDCTTGELTPSAEATNGITVTFADGLVLGAEATPVYLTVPAGSYGTFLVTLVTEAHNKMTVKFNSDVKPINAGVVREFSEFTYQENSSDTETGEYLIDSAEALINFAKIAGSFYPRTAAKVVADIDMTGIEWTPIANFGEYEFDGGSDMGFEIKGLSAPLFGTTAATIKNVKLTNVNYTVTDLAKSGAVVCELHGSIDNCSVSGAIEINNTTFKGPKNDNYNDVAHAALVGMAYNASITNCVNNASVTITSLRKADYSVKCTAGGVVGAVSNNCTIDNLTNNGNVTFASTNQKGSVYISGVIGKNDDTNGQNDFAAISNCTNNGNISSAATSVCGSDVLLAGITGRIDAGAATVVENLVNTGAITLAGKSSGARVAGIAAYTSSATLNNSYNTGAISAAATATFSDNVYLSGLISAAITTAGISNCYNEGAISVADGLTFTKLLDVSGCITRVNGNAIDALITGVRNLGPISVGKVINENKTDDGNNERMYVGGVFHEVSAGTLKECYNEAKGTINIDIKTWASRLMSGGLQAYQSYSVTGVNVDSCENRAALTYNAESLESATIGGIASEYYAPATHAGHINYKDVVNKGNITVTGTITTSGYPRLGGVLGLDNGPGLTMDGCVNEATITINTTDTAGPQVGGIIGADTNKKAVTIKNCENKGHIELAAVVTSYIRMGGILGSKTTNTPTNITSCVNSGTLAITGIQTKTGNAYAVGGIVGYVSTNGLTISECVNGVENNTTGKGAITLGTVPGGYGAGGILGMFGVDAGGMVVYVNDCTNYATVKQTGKGGGSGRGCLGGVVGATTGNKDKSYDKLYVDGCKNYGDIEYGEVACGDRISVGGIVGEPQQYSTAYITNCENHGTVAFKGKSCAKEISFGGIAGMISTSCEITDCVNRGTILVAGSTSANYEAGGITGSSSSGTAKILRCANYGEVKQTAYSTGTTQFGGIIGYAYTFGTIDDCHNHGQLTIKGADSADQLSVGGVIGYARYKVSDGPATISNCYNHANLTFEGRGKYYAGGVIGFDKSLESGTAVLTNLVNVGNLTFSSTATTCYYGGLVGAANNPVNGGVFYGDITAIGKEGKVGALLGKARTDDLKVTNCQIGGNFIYSKVEDTDAGGEEITVGVKTPIDLTMLYTTAIEASVAEGDGCSVITTKPVVPTVPAAPTVQ